MTKWDYISAVFNGPIVHLPDDRSINMEHCWTELENQSTWRKTCHSAPLSNLNPTLNELGLNPGLWGEIPETVNFDTALTKDYRAVPFREDHIHPLRAMPHILCWRGTKVV